jgi:hypothetical protein
MHRKLIPIGACVLALMSVVCVPDRAFGQECPQASKTGPDTPSQVMTLEGRLVFHDDIRRWFELQLYKNQCGQKSIQLLQIQKADCSASIGVSGRVCVRGFLCSWLERFCVGSCQCSSRE